MNKDLRFETATKKHSKDIEEYILAEFGTNEPITQSLGATSADLCDFYHDLSESGYSHEKYSTVVYDKDSKYNDSDKIPPEIDVGKHDIAEEISKGPYKQHKANQIFVYITTLEHRQRQLLGNGSRVLKLDILSVSKEYRGRGLAKDLTRRAIEMAQAEGCDWIATSATAAASQAIFEKMGFKALYEIPYPIFREHGVPVFQNLHDGCTGGKFMALRVKQ
ncbi:acetyltransferase, GNAT family [Oesophagostomum dentatum]|uniref:Acetyltransferase, GNAT family n=1 Tax=Oesophagostomum dentatum TaxID=61180 RepID=A0A0B1T542_OESDE|nr:acetyltransferase, GNAT family [Oesophagostomum dentatum]